MVVDLILVVLWLVACSGCGLWGDQWWWCLLMVVALVVDECGRERDNRERMRFVVLCNNLIKNLGVLNAISN